MTQPVISAEEQDVLLELSNIGAGHAVTSLSALLGRRRVSLRVPRVEYIPSARITSLVGGTGLPVVGIALGVRGAFRGDVLIVFRREVALGLAGLVTGRRQDELDEFGVSALEEVGNILASSYLNALAQMLGGQLMPSTPQLWSEVVEEVLEEFRCRQRSKGQAALVLVNEFAVEAERFVGHFLLFPDLGTIEGTLAAVRGPA